MLFHFIKLFEELTPGVCEIVVEDAGLTALFLAEKGKSPDSPEEVVEEAAVKDLFPEKVIVVIDVIV